MSKTTITHPDGSVTTVQSQSGCGLGCAWAFWILLGVLCGRVSCRDLSDVGSGTRLHP